MISFVDKGLGYIAGVIREGYVQWDLASANGFLQKFDARAKVFLLLFFIGIISFKHTIRGEIVIGALVFALTAVSRINVWDFYRRVLFFGFVFGFLIALPSSLNTVTRGEMVFRLIDLPRAYSFWGYHVPRQIGVTRQGMFGVMMLTLRVVNSVSLSLLVISTTPFHEAVKALKMFRVPDLFLMIVTLTYKYIFIFAKTVEEMYLAKKSRLAGRTNASEGRVWVAGRMAFIFRKTQLRCEEVFKAMLARGFSDNIRFYGDRVFRAGDWVFTVFVLSAGTIIILL